MRALCQFVGPKKGDREREKGLKCLDITSFLGLTIARVRLIQNVISGNPNPHYL